MNKKVEVSYENIMVFCVVNSEIPICLDEILTRLRNVGPKYYLACANPHALVVAKKKAAYFVKLSKVQT